MPARRISDQYAGETPHSTTHDRKGAPRGAGYVPIVRQFVTPAGDWRRWLAMPSMWRTNQHRGKEWNTALADGIVLWRTRENKSTKLFCCSCASRAPIKRIT